MLSPYIAVIARRFTFVTGSKGEKGHNAKGANLS
jgi:hypothetical protein